MTGFITLFCLFASPEIEFECLAQWKDGSGMYLYGSFTGSVVTNRDDMYRCMVSYCLTRKIDSAQLIVY